MTSTTAEPRYAKSHEWAQLDDAGIATVGISDYAQRALGDVVFVELPAVGSTVSAATEVAVVESVKAASDIYSPLSGEVTEVNSVLLNSPELLNASPLGEGWLFRVRASDKTEMDKLMSAQEYEATCT